MKRGSNYLKGLGFFFMVFVMVLGLTIVGCGGGGGGSSGSSSSSGSCGGGGGGSSGGGSGGGGGNASGQKAFYLAYKDETNYDLYLVDPANPTKPYKVPHKVNNGKITDVKTVLKYDYNASNHTITDTYPRWLFYKEASDNNTSTPGKLYRISLLKENGYPQPVEVDNNVCGINYSRFNFGYWYVTYRKADSNGVCSEYLVGSHTKEPTPLDGKGIVDVFTGGMDDPDPKGYLVVENGTFENCTLDLSSCSAINGSPSIQNWQRVATNFQNGDEYVCANNTLYKVTPTEATALNAPCGSNWDYRKHWDYKSDKNYIYALDGDNDTLHVFDYNGNEQQLIKNVKDFGQTNNYLVIRDTSGNLKAVEKGNWSNTITLATYFPLYYVISTNGAYWNKVVNSTMYACYWKEGDQSPKCNNTSLWVGFSLNRSLNGDNWNGGLWLYKLLRLDGTTSNDTLVAVNPSNMSTITLGEVPPTILDFLTYGLGLGENMLLALENATTNSTNSDVFFANLSKENSLQNITNTPDANETPVWY